LTPESAARMVLPAARRWGIQKIMVNETAAMAAKREARPFWRVLVAAFVLPILLLVFSLHHPDNITYYLQITQNSRLLLAEFLLLMVVLIPLRHGPAVLRMTGRQVALLALGIFIIGYAGHYLLLGGYDLSRDEQMASFDTMIYGAGHLVWPLPPLWQTAPNQLNTLFMLPVQHPVAWLSTYLPGHAMLRAGFAKLGDPALTGPVLNALSIMLLWACARRIWPARDTADQEACCIAVLLLVLSGQFVMTGMTAFAMSAHLTCDLLWLWLFLQDRRRSDLLALVVGFLGTGLHQPLFHPLFVLPFMVLVLLDRRWGRLALYGIGYAGILAFWFAWPLLTHALVSGPHSSASTTGTDYWTRLTAVLAHNHDNVRVMAANLLHFVTWQHLLLLPLLLAGCAAARRDRLAAALAAGFLALIAAMTILLPFQGHGFGYRYLHGFMGNVALLGGYGWRRMQPWHARLRPMFVRASLASLLVMLPLQGWLTHRLYTVYARLDAKIAATKADYIIIGEHDTPLALDLVLNRPDLSNRPIRLAALEIDDADALAQKICHPGVTMALPTDNYYRDVDAYYGWPSVGDASRRLAEFTTAFQDGGCRVIQLR
jgi:hypothetical protein